MRTSHAPRVFHLLVVTFLAAGSLLSTASQSIPTMQDKCTDEKGNPTDCPPTEECVDNQGKPCEQDDQPEDKPTPKPTRTPRGGGDEDDDDDDRGGKATSTPVPQVFITTAIIPPSISIFTADIPTIDQGQCANLSWKVDDAQGVSLTSDQVGELFVEPEGKMEVCPPKTSTYILTGYGKPGSVPDVISTTIIITVIPIPIQSCTSFDLGPTAVVIDFERPGAGTEIRETYRSQGVIFRSGRIQAPAMGAHSGANGATSAFGDLGSFGLPINATLPLGSAAVGMYVGREAPSPWGAGVITATLTGQVYDSAGRFVGLVSDSVDLPDGPLPISRCLVIRAGEGRLIRSFVLEYQDGEGNSLYDPRWMDDLTLLPATVTARDLPPVVTILTPANGARVTTSTISPLARIVEDIALSRVQFSVNGVSQDVGFYFSSSTDPRIYGATATLRNIRPFGSNTLEVIAVDSAGQVGRASITFSNWPIADLDIEVINVELVQAVQCLNNPRCRDNGVPMIIGKPTLARVYARILRGPASIAGISGAICQGTTGVDGCSGPLRPFGAITVTNAALDGLRRDLRLTLNFIIPEGWISSPGALRLTGYANYRGENVDECCLENNLRTVGVSVQSSKRLDIVFVQVRANGTTSDINERWPLAAWIARAYPIARVGVWETPGRILAGTYNFMDASGRSLFFSGCGEGWSNLLEGLWWHNFWTSDPADYTRYYGMVAPASLGGAGFTGCGATPGSVAGGIVSDASGAITAAQEVGHNHGRTHAPGCGAGGPDMGFPTSDGTLDDWGLDVSRLQLFPPPESYDYIGYCGGPTNTWTSVYTYLRMLAAIQSVAALPSGDFQLASLTPPGLETAEYFVGGGQVAPDAATFTYGFYRAFLPVGTADELAEGPYTFELLAPDDSVLYSRSFHPAQYSNHDPGESGSYQIVAPWVEGTVAVAIRYNGVEIGRKVASPTPPVVTLLTPLGGEVWNESGEVTVAWEASDADGDALAYTVQYSRDGGVNWATLSANQVDTTLVLDASFIPGSGQALVRVLASDGFHTASSQTAGTFSVPGKAPALYIGSPDAGYTVEEGWPVFLQAFGTDPEDGPLAAEDFLWESNLDGPLAAGDFVAVQTLSVGEHTLTVTAADSDGNLASASVQINVGASTAPAVRSAKQLPPLSDGFKRQAAVFGGGGLLLLGLGAFALVRFVRRRS